MLEEPICPFSLSKDSYTGTGVGDRSSDAQPFCQAVDIGPEPDTLDLTGDSYFQSIEELSADNAYWVLS
ncbi:MAG: hypothetical protein ABIK54_03730 [candidate division WOR-3 bacterium]